MQSAISRRKFLAQLGLSATAALPLTALASSLSQSVYNPASAIQFGCASITWSGSDTKAIQEVSSLGFKGIQLRANIYSEYSSRPEALKDLLTQYKLQLPVFSSGGVDINLSADATKAQLEKHLNHARLVKAVGGQYLQVTNGSRPKEGNPTSEDLKKYGALLTETGKRTADLGVTTVYHNHMHQLGEKPEEVDQILSACDTKYVKFLLDMAHYMQGGGDPVKAIQQYGSLIKVMHVKDVRDVTDENGKKNYQFVELGQGRVDFPAIFKALEKIKYNGWAIVELDSVPDKTRTPLEAATISRDYLRDKLKQKIG